MNTKMLLKWTAILIAGGTIAAGMITGLTFVFATKTEVLKLEKSQLQVTSDTKVRDFRIQRLEIQVQNVENIARRTDKNVVKLLTIRRLRPAPTATVQPLPPMPPPDSLIEESER